MKIHILCKESYPNGYAASNRINCYAEALSAAGYDTRVVVITRTEEKGQDRGNGNIDGNCGRHTFQYLTNPVRKQNKLLRYLDKQLDDFRVLRYLKKEVCEGDLIFLYLREMPVCRKILSAMAKRKVMVVRDLCEYPYRIDNAKNRKRANRYLNEILPQYDGVIAISESLYGLAKKHMKTESVIAKVPILINMDRKGVSTHPKELGKKYIFHSGSLYENKDGILGILKIIDEIHTEGVHEIHFVSSGKLESSPDYDLYNEFIKNSGIRHLVHFVGFLSDKEMIQYQKGASALIINKLDNLQNRNCFPTKLAEYLLSERPVLISDVGESKLYLNHGVDSFVFKNENYSELKAYLTNCLSDEKLSRKVGKAGYLTVLREFTYESQVDKLDEFVKELLAETK